MKKTGASKFLPLVFALGAISPEAIFALKTLAEEKEKTPTNKKSGRVTPKSKSLRSASSQSANSDLEGASSEATENQYPFNPQKIATADDFFLALDEPDVQELVLSNDIFIDQNAEIDHDLTIQLNGFHIISFQEGARVIDIKSGAVKIVGPGQIHALGPGSTAIRIKGATSSQANYATLDIDAEVKLYAPHYYGIYLAANFEAAYGLVVNFAGQMTARDGILLHSNIQGHGENLPTVNLLDGAGISVDESLGVALQADGHGIWRIGEATITGATGAEIKSGELYFTNSKIIATGETASEQAWADNFSSRGAVFALKSEGSSARGAKIKISGGIYQSLAGYVFVGQGQDEAAIEKLEIMAGEFSGRLDVFSGLISEAASGAVQVKGGSFSTEISRYLATDYYLYLEKDDAGRYVVQGNAAVDENVDEEQQKLNVALAKLINLVALAEHFISPDYHAGNFGSLQKSIDKSVKKITKTLKKSYQILENQDAAEFADVATEIANLEQVTAEMQEVENILRSELAGAVDDATTSRRQYTEESYAELAEILERSEELLGRDELNLPEIDAMLGEIDAAKLLLEEREISDEEELDELPVVPIEDLLEDEIAPEKDEVSEKTFADYKLELQELLAEVDALSVLDYTAESFSLLLELTMAAEQILNDEVDGLTSEDLAEIIENINVAREALIKADPKTEEENLLENFANAEATSDEEPIIDHESIIDDEIEELVTDDDFDENLVESSDLISNEDLDEDSTNEFDENLDLIPALKIVPPTETEIVRSKLCDLLAETDSLNPNDYTSESYLTLAEAVAEAKRLLQTNSENVSAEILSSLVEVIQSTRRSLVAAYNPAVEARENLIAMLEAVQNLSVSDYFESTAEQFGELQVAITKAHAILAKPTADFFAIVTIMDEIKLATSGLKGGEETLRISREKLEAEIADAENIATEKYTAESLASFDAAKLFAKQILATENSSFSDFDDATNKLHEAKLLLTRKPADWSALRSEIAKIAGLNCDDYTKSSYDQVLFLLEEAKSLLRETEVAQETVDELVAKIQIAVDSLELKPINMAVIASELSNMNDQISAKQNLSAPNWNLSNYDEAPSPYVAPQPNLGPQGNTYNPATADYNKTPTGYYTPRPAENQSTPIPPNMLMSVMAGAYAGLAAYRRSRLDAKNRKQRRRANV